MALHRTAAEPDGNVWTSYSTRDRTLLTIGAVVCYALFGLAANLFSIPQNPRYEASLMMQPVPMLAIVVVAIVLVAGVLVASLIAGKVHFEGGLFCAAIGMAALSTRGGPMRYVLMYAPSPAIYLRMAGELMLLLGCIIAGWYVLLMLRDNNFLRGEPLREDDPHALPAAGAMSLGAQVIMMVFLVAILAQTDKKAQVIWSVAIASSVSALAAHSLFPARPSIWFWTAPFIVGVIGYVVAWFGGPPGVGGEVGGMLPALARPLPLDYASVGTAGALFGYWTSRRWQHEREHEPHTTGEVEEALEHIDPAR
jgi:hypothetical protein